jgi:DNA-binding beta-propeller fold protein YncE
VPEGMQQTGVKRGRVSRLARSARLGAVALLGPVIAVLLIWSTPAHALSQRGHTFAGSFGEAFFAEGRKVNPKDGPSAVAVNDAAEGEGAGDVYALDSVGNRVVRFGPGPEHAFIEAWGYGVKDGAESKETCTSSCELGIAGVGNGQFASPPAIAIDNAPGSPSKGDVYVVANQIRKSAVLDKFSPAGKLLETLRGNKELGVIVGVAVDSDGNVWIERQEGGAGFDLEEFNNAVKNKLIAEPPEDEVEGLGGTHPARPGLAVSSSGDVYVTYERDGKSPEELHIEAEEIAEREKARAKNHEELKHEMPQQPCTANLCLVGEIALTFPSGGGEITKATLTGELDAENSTGVALDLSSGAQSSGDVYVDNATSVAAFDPSGALIQRFGSEQLQGGGGSGLAVDSEANAVFVADAALGRLDVFKPSEPGPPVVEAGSVGAAHVTSSTAELGATIDPAGALTHYRFLYGTSACTATPTPCVEAPAAPGGSVGQGFGDQGAAETISGLAPSTSYHVLAIAENQFAEGAEAVVSEELTFVTASAAAVPLLPDGREWELVSPAEKHGASVEPIPSPEGGLVESSLDGRSLTYMTTAPVGENEPEGNRAPERSQTLAGRGASGWSSRDIVTPNEHAESTHLGIPREYLFFSPDLAEALLEPASAQPLSAEADEERTPYVRHNTTCVSAPSSCYEPLITTADVTSGERFSAPETVEGATPGLGHVVINSNVPLVAPEKLGGLYEWSAGTLAPVSILPNGTQAPGGKELKLGGGALQEMHSPAISEDGSRVVWRVGGSNAGHLYMRDMTTGESIQIDEPNSGVPTPVVEPIPDFKTASADGSKVFFSDNQRLTVNSTAPEEPHERTPRSDLYVFEPEKPAGERLTDLTPDLNSGEAAAVRGEILASRDGTIVYFVANGVLSGEAQPGDCRIPGTSSSSCNLYVEHYAPETPQEAGHWEAPRLVARLSALDDPDWAKPGTEAVGGFYNLKYMTSRASPSGEYLAFMSSRSLTGYDNRDARSGVPDEEVFLYHYAPEGKGHTVCVSCIPGGSRPTGVFDTQASGEGIGLAVDRALTWVSATPGQDHWLAGNIPAWTAVGLERAFYQSRYLSDSGRLFFDSSDALSPRDVNGKEDVYEYERLGTGSCRSENAEDGCVALISSGDSPQESSFLDASENGNDVFFLTNSQLTPQAIEEGSNIFDARVCGVEGAEACATPPPAPPAPCSGEGCKPSAEPQPSFGSPASSTLTGSGNLAGLGQVLPAKVTQKPKPLTRAQKLTAALKHCHKLSPKTKRALCEKKARKAYGPKKPSAAHKTTAKPTTQAKG